MIRHIRSTSQDWNDGYEQGWKDSSKENEEHEEIRKKHPPIPHKMNWLQKALHRIIWRLESLK